MIDLIIWFVVSSSILVGVVLVILLFWHLLENKL